MSTLQPHQTAGLFLVWANRRADAYQKPPQNRVADYGAKGDMRAAIYLRVSTDEQTTDNQERELRATAERAGHEVVAVYRDAGISGAKGRDKRPGFDAMNKDAARRRFAVVMTLSVDRPSSVRPCPHLVTSRP